MLSYLPQNLSQEDYLSIAAALAICIIFTWLLTRSMYKKAAERTDSAFQAEKEALEVLANTSEQQCQKLEDANQAFHQEVNSLKAELKERSDNLIQSNTRLEALSEQRSEMQKDRAELSEELRSLNLSNVSLREQLSALESKRESELKQADEKLSLLNDAKERLSVEFKNLANEILEAKGKTFAEQNIKSLDSLLNPFKEQIEGFRKRVDDVHSENIKGQSDLRSEVKRVLEVGLKMNEEAHGLATALKGQKKMQGNWGELILENVLERAGLEKGKDYRREVSFNTEEGRSRPDVIVYLPDNKHLVVDAKVSLNAYTRYVNEEDEVVRQQALREHVKAISDRIKELSDKNYFNLPGINSPDMVFMFIPIESAFVEALKGDEGLFQKAIEQNILVATPTTLLTSLNIVQQLWRFEDQNKHTAELADRAAKFYKKLNTFLLSMEGVGKQLDKAQVTYFKAFGQLYSGPNNLIKQASEFKKLGVSVQAELPENLVEKANLELDQLPDVDVSKSSQGD